MVREEAGWLKTVGSWGEIQDKVRVDKQPTSGHTDNSECSSPFTFNQDLEDVRKTDFLSVSYMPGSVRHFSYLVSFNPVRILGSRHDQVHSWERKWGPERVGDSVFKHAHPRGAVLECRCGASMLKIPSSCSARPAKAPRWACTPQQGRWGRAQPI